MDRTIHLPRLGMTVTVAPSVPATRTVNVEDLDAARRTQAELLAILSALAAGTPESLMMRSAVGMARHVSTRLDAMAGRS
jgi:hypothetical protein